MQDKPTDYIGAVADYLELDEAFAITQEERDKLPASSFGWPSERKYPVTDQTSLDSAVKLIGKAPADKRDEIKRNLIKIAKRKKLTLPEAWTDSK